MLIEPPALTAFVEHLNELRQIPEDRDNAAMRSVLENAAATLFGCTGKLAVYGSLKPGEENHHVIEDMVGTWSDGFVRGTLFESGWGAAIGYPAMHWSPDGDRIDVRLFESPDLETHWARLDEFEGDEYIRILVPVENEAEVLAVANIYALRERNEV